MGWDGLFPLICGYEMVGDQVRLYVEGPTPTPSYTRQRGVRSALFHLYSGNDAASVRCWLSRNMAWQCLRVPPPFTPERGVRAVLAASNWHGGRGSALHRLAATRVIADEAHRQRLHHEVRQLVATVLENPVHDGELQQLQAIEDVANVAPVGVELCGAADVVDAFFGSAG